MDEKSSILLGSILIARWDKDRFLKALLLTAVLVVTLAANAAAVTLRPGDLIVLTSSDPGGGSLFDTVNYVIRIDRETLNQTVISSIPTVLSPFSIGEGVIIDNNGDLLVLMSDGAVSGGSGMRLSGSTRNRGIRRSSARVAASRIPKPSRLRPMG